MERRRCPEPCGKIIYSSRRMAHRLMGKQTNQFAYWDPDCKVWHTSSSRKPVRKGRYRRRAA